MLIYPTIQTINYSFANADSTAYVGLAELPRRSSATATSGRRWSTTCCGWSSCRRSRWSRHRRRRARRQALAQGEKVAKSLIFLPMAISFVGASAIWGLVYAYNDPGQTQTGLLNAIMHDLAGDPQAWLQVDTARLNSLLLMVILIWLQAGLRDGAAVARRSRAFPRTPSRRPGWTAPASSRSSGR